MTGREFDRDGKGLLKAIGWSVAFGVEGLLLGMAVIVGVVFLTEGEVNPEWFDNVALRQALIQGIGLTIGFGVATLHLGRRVLGLSWESLRWRGTGPSGAWFARGLALGLAASAMAMVVGLAVAGASWSTGAGTILGWLGTVATTAAALALPALAEEIVFRGLPLVLLAGVIGRGRAVAVAAVAFGLMHLPNPGVTALGLANISLAGVLLGTAFYAPGGIWTAWGAHLGWNLSLAGLGAPVSGLPLAIPWLTYDPGGPDWLTGGAFGPEGGLLASVASIAAILIALRWIPKGEGTA